MLCIQAGFKVTCAPCQDHRHGRPGKSSKNVTAWTTEQESPSVMVGFTKNNTVRRETRRACIEMMSQNENNKPPVKIIDMAGPGKFLKGCYCVEKRDRKVPHDSHTQKQKQH